MKLSLLFLLALTVHQITSAEAPVGGSTQLNSSDINQNQGVQDALAFGANYVVTQAIKDQALPDGTYEVIAVYSVYSQVVSGVNYQFDIEIKNNFGTFMRATYVVYVQSWSDTTKVTFYNYKIGGSISIGQLTGLTFLPEEVYSSEDTENNRRLGEEDSNVGGWSLVNPDEASKDVEIQSLLHFGGEYVASQGIQSHTIPNSLYHISKVFNIYQQVVSGMNYKFDVELENTQDFTIRVSYVVYYVSWENIREVTSYSFDATDDTNATSNENEDLPSPAASAAPGGWNSVDPKEAESDADLKNALQFGIQQLTQEAIIKGELPDEDYQFESFNSIEEQIVNGINYQFNVNLLGNAGTTVVVSFEVYSQPSTGTEELISYSIIAVGEGAAGKN